MRRTRQDAATLEVSPVVLQLPWGLLWLWECHMPILDLNEVRENKKPFCMRIFL